MFLFKVYACYYDNLFSANEFGSIGQWRLFQMTKTLSLHECARLMYCLPLGSCTCTWMVRYIQSICMLLCLKIHFGMNKEKFTRAGFESATSGLTCAAGALPTELTSPILAVCLFCQYLCSAGASQKSFNHILPFSQGSRPSYNTTWEEAVRGCTIRGYNFFFL